LCGFHRIDKPRRAAPHRSAICEQALLENKRKTSQQKKYIKINTDGSGVQCHSLRGLLNSVEKKKDC